MAEESVDYIADVPQASTYDAPDKMGSIKPYPDCDRNHLEESAEGFKKAFKGLGTDEYRIIKLLTEHDNEQRQQIKDMYKTIRGRDLEVDLKSELSGNFEDGCMALLTPPVKYKATCLKLATKGAGTNEAWLVDILCAQKAQDLRDIMEEYKKLFKVSAEEDIEADTTGVFQKVMISMCQGNRDQTPQADVDLDLAKQDAKDLYDAGEGKLGTDEETFNRIFAVRSWGHLREVFQEYQNITQRDIVESIDREFSFNAKKAFMAIAKYAQDPATYFAERIHEALVSIDSDEESIIRLIVSHSETDLENIKNKYMGKYGTPLEEDVKKECRGDFKKLMVRVVNPSAQHFK